MPVIYGFLERITYHNEENDFVVARLQEKGKRDLTTIIGNLTAINPGESLKLRGRWVPSESIKTTWAKCCAKANVRDPKINDIRHKAITDMVQAGFPLETVPSTTQRYTHLTVDATKAAGKSGE